ncbi:hypothetical protein [Nocardia sp. NPDC050793]|uniref:hypothetical protein n=1 Tax=Nocardia sp. NPDC050793 TaxID=3155159 RepID=UPI0033F589DE
MSVTPPVEDHRPQPTPSGQVPFWELYAAVILAVPVGFLVDWPTAVQVLLTIFAGLMASRIPLQ